MANPIFQKKASTKATLYNDVKDILTAAGWTNISSNPGTQDVFFSRGESGDKEVHLLLIPTDKNGYNCMTNVNAQSFRASLVEKYTPGTAGAAGTYSGSTGTNPTAVANTYDIAFLPSTGMSNDTPVNILYTVNKNRLIVIFEQDPVNTQYAKHFLHYFGLPNETYVPESTRGAIYASNVVTKANNGGSTAAFISLVGYPSNLADTTGLVSHTPKSIVSFLGPNAGGKMFLTDVYYDHTSVGLRGRLDGIFFVNSTNVGDKDKIIVGTEEYTVYLLSTATSIGSVYCVNSFPTSAVAVRTA